MKVRVTLKEGFTDVNTASVSLDSDNREEQFDLSESEIKALENTGAVEIQKLTTKKKSSKILDDDLKSEEDE